VRAVSLRIRIYIIAGVHSIVFRYLYLVKRKKALSFNFTFRYKDDVLSLNNYVDRIYPIEPEIKDITYTNRSASYLDLHREIDSEERLRTKLYDKRDDFNFHIVNFPFIRSTIPTAHAIWVCISQMIGYSRACGSYHDSLDRGCC
jgi:hypothetical protein